MFLTKDDRAWRIGEQADVDWIRHGTSIGLTLTAAVPDLFESYATIVLPEGWPSDTEVMVELLERFDGDQPWWLGYLATGASDVVFPEAPMVTLYSGWKYVFALAGPEQARSWRRDHDGWNGAIPNLVFAQDRSWMLTNLWDDDWRYLAGPAALIDSVVADERLTTYRVRPGENSTPPGHTAR